MKITTTVALIFAFLFLLAAHGQAEEHYIYKDAQGRLVISNQQPRAGSTVLRKLDLTEFRDAQMQPVQAGGSTRSTGKLEGPTQTGPKEINSWLAKCELETARRP